MQKLIAAATAALMLLATPGSAAVNTDKENEAYIGLFFGASLAALLVVAHEDEAESD